ncbi:MAG: hypothetical protein HY721_09640, partial [Planctomycetes bacterium]|nr:hypothetical protein [Planctomycetota bacterium]
RGCAAAAPAAWGAAGCGAPAEPAAGGREAAAGAAGLDGSILLVDLDHLYLWKPLSHRGRLKNLAQAANLPEGHVSTADRLRALKAYAAGDATYRSRPWIRALRARLLREHRRVLESLCRGELERSAAPSRPCAPPRP